MRDKALRDAREEQQELEALHRLDEECVHQQRAGNYLKAFDCMERALVLRRHFFGIESEEVIQACRALAEMCNLLAMSFLQQDNYPVTIDLLKKAELLTQRHHPAERATTLNNLACYYRRLGKLHAAMTSLKRALELEKRLENTRDAADTQLNMCAVLSQLGKHQEALEHAQEALITLQEGFIHSKTTAIDTAAGETSSSRLDRISVMCIAYHNIGVEQEFLKDFAESVASYKKGIGLAEQYLGADHSITTTIRNSYLAAKRTLAAKTRVKSSSAICGHKSPSKAEARLLLSPRSGSLRMPSPLAKEKDHHNGSQIPTPRSIVADALSRPPLSSLPPLEIQSPPSASKKKKKPDSSEVKSTAPPLSPTDPFFSPRFRFDSDTTESKTKKLVSITSPRSVAAASVEVRTPPSSKGKRARRKSSVKKPPVTSENSGKTANSSVDERMSTLLTPQAGEEDFTVDDVPPKLQIVGVSDAAVDNASGEIVATETNVDVSALAGGSPQTEVSVVGESSNSVNVGSSQDPEMPAQIDSTVITSHDITELADLNISDDRPSEGNGVAEQQNGSIAHITSFKGQELERCLPSPREIPSMLTSEDLVDLVLEGVDAARLTSLASVVSKEAEPEVYYDEADNVNESITQEETHVDSALHDDHAFVAVKADDKTETGENFDARSEAKGDLENETEISKDHALNADLTSSELISGVARVQDLDQLSDDAVEVNAADTNQERSSNPIGNTDTGSSIGDIQNDLKAANSDAAEHTSDVENAETSVNEASNEFEAASADRTSEVENLGNLEMNESSEMTAIKDHASVEDNDTTAVFDEQTQSVSTNAQEVDGVAADSHYNKEIENIAPVESAFESFDTSPPFDTPEDDQTILTGDLDEQAVGEAEESQFSNVSEFASDGLESQEYHVMVESEGGIYYDESYTSAELPTLEVEAQENIYEEVHQDEVDSEDCLHSDPEPGDQTEQMAIYYEQQSHEEVDDPLSTEVEQGWSCAEQAEPAAAENTADYSDYYQNASVPWQEEQQYYDEHAETSENVDGQLQNEDLDLPTNESTIDVDSNAQDSATTE